MTTPAESRAALQLLLLERLKDDHAAAWLAEKRDLESLRAVLTDVRRVVGARPLVAGFQDRDAAALETAWGPMKIGRWTTDGAARVLLVANAAQREAQPYAALHHLYDLGDTEARAATLHAIDFIDDSDSGHALEMIADAGRTYLDPLIDAAWLDNPFSAAHLTDVQYRKAVLKALFCGLDVSRFIGLEARADAELAKSLCEFADEREAAGRPVPAAVWVVAARHARPGLAARLLGRMEHPLPAERLVAAQALASAADGRTLSFIEERLVRETDPAVREALETARTAAAR